MDTYHALERDDQTVKILFSKLLKTTMEDKARRTIFNKLISTMETH